MTIRDTFNRPLRDLRISVTDRCNFRCTYCMPAAIYGESYKFLPRQQVLTFEEITRLAGGANFDLQVRQKCRTLLNRRP